MQKERWLSLSNQEQQAWDTCSNRSKFIISGIIRPDDSTKYKSNLHDISSADYLMMIHQNKSIHNITNSKISTIEDQNNLTNTKK